jgi:hypothetical protein
MTKGILFRIFAPFASSSSEISGPNLPSFGVVITA